MKTICITLQNGMNCATAAEEENYYYNIILDADLIESVKIVLCAKRTRTDRVQQQQQQTDICIYSWEWDRRRVSLICTKIVQRDASKIHTHSHRAIARHTGGGYYWMMKKKKKNRTGVTHCSTFRRF